MAEPEEFYTPASVDKQVDALLSGDTMPIHDQHLAHDLRAFLAPENEDARSLERVFARFQEYQRAEYRQQGTVLPFPEPPGQLERFPVMWSTTRVPSASRVKPWRRIVSLFAAVLVVVTLVGSAILLLNAQNRTHTAGSNTISRSSATPTPMPKPGGKVVHSSGKFGDMLPGDWSPDGTRVAVVVYGKTIHDPIRLESWDALTGKNVLIYPTSGPLFANVAWSPDGKTLAVAGSTTIFLFDAQTAAPLRTLSLPVTVGTSQKAMQPTGGVIPLSSMVSLGGGSAVGQLAWSPDSTYLAAKTVLSSPFSITIWNTHDGSIAKTLTPLQINIADISWSPDGKSLAVVAFPTTSETTEAQIWDTTLWKLTRTYPRVIALSWSPDSHFLALVDSANTNQISQGKDVRVVDASTGRTSIQFADQSNGLLIDVRWSLDGRNILTETSASSNNLSIWNALNGSLVVRLASENVSFPRWSPKGKYISGIQTIPPKDPAATHDQRLLIFTASGL
ncbi:MAG TPA: hypothetical protein VFN35_29790 [Ktedonobacteraceae bacterium]|nr:hypothetical protein [Ktedonobacteraceae bacterium]